MRDVSGEPSREDRAQEDALRRADVARRLIRVAAHDLRSPLTAVSLSAHNVLARKDLDERLRASVARIASSGERANRILRDLVDLAEAELDGSVALYPRSVNLPEAIQRAVDAVRHANPGREVRLDVQGVTPAAWDPERVAQIVTTLVENGVQRGPAGTPVDARAALSDAGFLLSVHDHGPPIPDDAVPLLFDPGRRGDRPGAGGGGGLALVLAERLVQAHGGRIEVTSHPDDGTRFTAWLPARRDAAPA